MAKKVHVGPYGIWRDGRPRFVPGARERALGFTGCDLRHGDGGPWFTFEEARGWLIDKQNEIAAARGSGRAPRVPTAPRGQAVNDLWEAYTKSKTFLGAPEQGLAGLAPKSQVSYRAFIKPLANELIWRAPHTSVTRDMIANEERGLYRRLVARHGLSMANATIAVLSAAYRWGMRNGWNRTAAGVALPNPCADFGRTAPEPRVRVATEEELQALVAAADRTMRRGVRLCAVGDAILAAFYSGQRKSDILELVAESDSAQRITLRQNKTGARVSIPKAPRLSARIAEAMARRRALPLKVLSPNLVIDERTGQAYAGGEFAKQFRIVCNAAIAGVIDEAASAEAAARGINEPVYLVPPCPSLALSTNPNGETIESPFTFPDLRDTCVTWLARAGCELPEIAAITGHSLKSIYAILKHYLQIDEKLADAAIGKLMSYMEREGLAV